MSSDTKSVFLCVCVCVCAQVSLSAVRLTVMAFDNIILNEILRGFAKYNTCTS